MVVNRQLCVANAFEQVLEERFPPAHRRIRDFYDHYGLPIARLIRSPYAADAVYIAMKPLEWFFLLILYLSDARPEDRIRMQYIDPIPDPRKAVRSRVTVCHSRMLPCSRRAGKSGGHPFRFLGPACF